MKKRIAKLKNLTQPDAYDLTEVETTLLQNLEKYQALLKSFDNVVKRTAAATGVSERTLNYIKHQAKTQMAATPENGNTKPTEIDFSPPKRDKPRKKRLPIDDNMISSIRKIIDRYTEQKKVPTLSKILDEAKRDLNFPGQKFTLYQIIKEKLGYKFRNNNWDRDVEKDIENDVIIPVGAECEVKFIDEK